MCEADEGGKASLASSHQSEEVRPSLRQLGQALLILGAEDLDRLRGRCGCPRGGEVCGGNGIA